MGVRKDAKRGVWFIDFWYADKSGQRKRFRKDSSAQTRRDSLQEEARLQANCALYGGPFAPVETTVDGAITFQKATEEFRLGAAKVKLKASTRHAYNEILDGILLPKFGKDPISKIDLIAVQKLDGEMVDKGCSASRRRNVQIVLRSVLGVAVDGGRLSALPKLPPLPKVGRSVVKVMTPKQVEMIIEYAAPMARLPFAIAAYCGLRAGEIRALKGKSIDLQNGWITVEESLSHGEVDSPKSGHQRKVPIPNLLLGLIKLAFSMKKFTRDDYVCKTDRGEPWGDHGLLKAFQRAARKANVVGFTFHSFRHFYITHMFRSGTPAQVIKQLAGHEHLATTQRYSHSDEDDAKRARENFTRLLAVGGDAGSNDANSFDLGNIWETDPSNDDPHKV